MSRQPFRYMLNRLSKHGTNANSLKDNAHCPRVHFLLRNLRRGGSLASVVTKIGPQWHLDEHSWRIRPALSFKDSRDVRGGPRGNRERRVSAVGERARGRFRT